MKTSLVLSNDLHNLLQEASRETRIPVSEIVESLIVFALRELAEGKELPEKELVEFLRSRTDVRTIVRTMKVRELALKAHELAEKGRIKEAGKVLDSLRSYVERYPVVVDGNTAELVRKAYERILSSASSIL